VFWRRDNSLAPTRNQTPYCQVCSIATILTTLPWLPVTLLCGMQGPISWDVMTVWRTVTTFNSPPINFTTQKITVLSIHFCDNFKSQTAMWKVSREELKKKIPNFCVVCYPT
jgi:hypothetical protein